MPPLRAVIVAAVSTAAQADKEHASIPEQLKLCRETCEARGWQVVEEISIEGHSRNYDWLDKLMADCPEYARLIKMIDDERMDLIVVRDYDRLWRTVSLQGQVMARCKQHRVQIFSCGQPSDVVSPELLIDRGTQLNPIIFSFMSEQENRIRARRHKMGMKNRTERGLYTSGVTPYGYRKTSDKQLEIDEDKATWVRWMFQRRVEGLGYARIAHQLNDRGVLSPTGVLWAPGTIHKIVHNITYAGGVRWGDTDTMMGQHEAIIDDDLWQRVLDRNEYQRTTYAQPQTAHVYALSGLLTCGLCGGTVGYNIRGAGRRGYALRCLTYASKGRKGCTAAYWNAGKVEAQVLKRVKEIVANPAIWREEQERAENRPEIQAEMTALQHEIDTAKAKWQRWNNLFGAGGITADELLIHRDEISVSTTKATAHLEELQRRYRDLGAVEQRFLSLQENIATLDAMPRERLNQVYRVLMRSVTLYKDGREPLIVWR